MDIFPDYKKNGDNRPRWGAVDSLVAAPRENRTDRPFIPAPKFTPGPALPYNSSDAATR